MVNGNPVLSPTFSDSTILCGKRTTLDLRLFSGVCSNEYSMEVKVAGSKSALLAAHHHAVSRKEEPRTISEKTPSRDPAWNPCILQQELARLSAGTN